MQTSLKRHREPMLDGFRAIAVIAVMVYHLPSSPLPGGFLGVDFFFVLSGFLITALLFVEWEETGAISLRAFYARRALRLLPALLLLLLALWGAVLLFRGRFKTDFSLMTRATGFTLAYLSNWVSAFHLGDWPSVMDHLWSLAVEEQFYLLWPILLWIMLRSKRSPKRLVMTSLVIALGTSACWRALLWYAHHDYARVYYATDTRADALALGCALGVLASGGRLPSGRIARVIGAIGACLLLLAVLLVRSETDTEVYGGHLLAAVAAGACLIGIGGDPPEFIKWVLGCFPIVWIGRVSYGLYLFHVPIFYTVRSFGGISSPVGAALSFGATFLCAALSYHLFEQRALRLKSRLVLRQRAPVSVEGVASAS